MNIYTSYFRKAMALDSSKYCLVSIARKAPRGFHGVSCLSFAPSSSLLDDYHRGLSISSYSRRYRAEINELFDIHHIFESLAVYCQGRDMILCCWEGGDKFCHRHLLSDIIFEKFGYRISEL